MILDREKAVRDALAAAAAEAEASDAASLAIPPAVLDAVRGLPPPPPSDAALHLVHAVATRNAAAVSDAVHTNHERLGAELVRVAVQALQTMDAPREALECSAFARYELRDARVPAVLPRDADLAGLARDTNAGVTPAGFARSSGSSGSSGEASGAGGSSGEAAGGSVAAQARGYLAQRPWLLELVLEQSSDTRTAVDAWWPLVVPALLNVLDTTDLRAKARGVRLTRVLAQRFGAKLQYAGLAPVFEAAVEPCLSFLPPLEDAARTQLVFAPAVLCLGALAQAQAAGVRVSRLHFVAREGCLKAFLHAYEHVELTIYFFDTLRRFVDTYLQSLTAAHLSGIVRVFLHVTTDPFVDASPALVAAAGRAMAAAVRWAWPRVGAYKYSILLGLTKANALDTECCELLDVSADERRQLEERARRQRAAFAGA